MESSDSESILSRLIKAHVSSCLWKKIDSFLLYEEVIVEDEVMLKRKWRIRSRHMELYLHNKTLGVVLLLNTRLVWWSRGSVASLKHHVLFPLHYSQQNKQKKSVTRCKPPKHIYIYTLCFWVHYIYHNESEGNVAFVACSLSLHP